MGVLAEGYYEDEGYDEAWATGELPRDLRARMLAVLGTSWGTSLLVHLGILLILATIIISQPRAAQEAVLIVKSPPVIVSPPDPIQTPDLKDQPPIETEVELTNPVLIPPDEPIPEPPKGVDMDNLTTKDLRSDSLDDAFGLTGAAAGRIGLRGNKGLGDKYGRTPGSVNKVRLALIWLQRHQAPDGSWHHDYRPYCDPQQEPCGAPGVDEDHEIGMPQLRHHRVGLTGLALLAFLADGSTHRFGTFRRQVRDGLRYLKQQQRADGAVGYRGGETMYDHLVATMAFCEDYAITRDILYRRAAQRAVDFAVGAQNPGLGLRYEPRNGRNDTSVTGWLVLALKSARAAGLEVPEEAFTGALAWFSRATDRRGSTGYQTPGGGSSYLPPNQGRFEELPVNTAVSVLCSVFGGARRSEDRIRQGLRAILQHLPRWEQGDTRSVNFYYWYYGTYAMFQGGGDPAHDKAWKTWNAAMLKALLPTGRVDGCATGSWDPVGEWCLAGGRVYATAINALTLQIYTRFKRAHTEDKETEEVARAGGRGR